MLFLGDVLLEREGTYGALETRMALAVSRPPLHGAQSELERRHAAGRRAGELRSPGERLGAAPGAARDRSSRRSSFLGFGMAASLQEVTDRSGDILLNPDVVRYGREPMTAERFKSELAKLMDTDRKRPGGPRVRFVLLSPIAHEDLRAGRPGTARSGGASGAAPELQRRHRGARAGAGARYLSLPGMPRRGAKLTATAST